MNNTLLASVALTCKDLSDIELNTLHICMQLDQDPRGRIFDYENVKSLFTESNGTKAHAEVKECVAHLTGLMLERQ